MAKQKMKNKANFCVSSFVTSKYVGYYGVAVKKIHPIVIHAQGSKPIRRRLRLCRDRSVTVAYRPAETENIDFLCTKKLTESPKSVEYIAPNDYKG